MLRKSRADRMFEKLGYEIKMFESYQKGYADIIKYSKDDTVIIFYLDTRYILISNVVNQTELKAIWLKNKELKRKKWKVKM